MKHPVQDLIALATEIRHVRAEHARRPQDSAWFRRHGAQMAELVARYDQLVERWGLPEHRDAWRALREGRGEAPESPVEEPPPLWYGQAADGSELEILPKKRTSGPKLVAKQQGDVSVYLDGELLERDLAWHHPTLAIGDVRYVEAPRCPTEAVEALRRFVGARGEPPWTYARALLDDGLVDRDFGLTERGRRLVEALGGAMASEGPRWTRWAG